jgi:hypothetical protein
VSSAETCIYCRASVPITGVGDHVVSAALGRFQGELYFTRICRKCNSIIGRCEEQVLKCAPEAYLRRMLRPVVDRNERGMAWVGAHGSPPPKFTVKHADHHELVEQFGDNPEDVRPVDQIVVVDREGNEHHIRLFPKMTAAHVRAKLGLLEPQPGDKTFLHADDQYYAGYVALLKELWPRSEHFHSGTTEAGTHRVEARTTFTFHADYWRAIAKIAFHYYLVTSKRGKAGDEPEFQPIRRFIIEGGDKSAFFDKPNAQFVTPFREVAGGGAFLANTWAHLLAADETYRYAVAAVSLFMGPKRLAPVYHVNLATFPVDIIVPNARSAHSYVYYPDPSAGDFAGRVVKDSLTQLG